MSSSGAPPVSTLSSPDPSLRRKTIFFVLFCFGLVSFAFVLGAAVMFFQLPSSDFLAKGFVGGRAWVEWKTVDSDQPPDVDFATDGIDKPRETFDGFTLCTFAAVNAANTQAYLLDMRRQLRHRWRVQFSHIWPNPTHIRAPVDDRFVCFFGCHLYPNGDLLVVMHGVQQLAVGYGLVKLDKDSKVVWSYPANIHHDIDVGPDGTIYAIQHEVVKSMPSGLRFIPTPSLVDSIITLTPDGKPKGQPISVLEAFRDSPYAALLASLEPARRKDERPLPMTGPHFDEKILREDALHTNFVKVLTPELARRFPGWKPGQLLISMRNIDVIALLDPELRTIVWAARGPWQAQHDVQFLDNGNLLLFDNRGLPKGSRVLEYNPRTQAFPWTWSGEGWGPFYSSERGLCQRLANGNTLAVNSDVGEIIEVNKKKEVVWSYKPDRFIPYARRYGPEQIQFLAPGVRPRP